MQNLNLAMKHILFVCSGNIFRSVSAELCFKNYIKSNKLPLVRCSSCGLTAYPQEFNFGTKKAFDFLGIDYSSHKQTQITKKIVLDSDLIVAMAQNHKDFVEDNYKKKTYLFNFLATGENNSVPDLNDVIYDWYSNKKAADNYCYNTILEINSKIPAFYKNALKFLK